MLCRKALPKYIERASKRKQIKKQKKESWKENETNNKFYGQNEQDNGEEGDSYVQQYKY